MTGSEGVLSHVDWVAPVVRVQAPLVLIVVEKPTVRVGFSYNGKISMITFHCEGVVFQ